MKLSEHESPYKVKLGDEYQYQIKGSGEYSYILDSSKSLTMKEVLFVPGLKRTFSPYQHWMQKECGLHS